MAQQAEAAEQEKGITLDVHLNLTISEDGADRFVQALTEAWATDRWDAVEHVRRNADRSSASLRGREPDSRHARASTRRVSGSLRR